MTGPTSGGDDLSARLSALTPEQRALFEALRKKKAAPKLDLKPPPIPRREPGGEHWPLSFDQERLWFLYALDPQATTFNIESVTRLSGPLRVAALRQAFRAVLRRHESWRTRFPSVDGEPVQVVDAPEAFVARVGLPLVDLAALPKERRDPEVRRILVGQARSPFVLEEGPLVRAALLRVDAEVHDFLLTVHHIVTDWVSFQIFWSELITLYGARVEGRPANLPEPPVQYADFAVWQREWLQGEVLETYRRYWQERLAGAPLVLDLPTDRPRPAVPMLHGAQIPLEVDAARHAGLKALSRREGLTLFMTLLAAYQGVLARLSGQETVLAATANANRNRPEIEPLLGYFLTQLVFRLDLGGDPTLREVLRRARETALGAYAHQELPFGKLVEVLQPERDLSRPPVVQVVFQVLSGQFDNQLDLHGIELQTLEPLDKSSDAEHIVSLWDEPDRLYGWWEYQTALFDRSTIERAWEDFQRILDALLEDPERRLSQVPVLSPAATHQVLIAWNETAAARVPEGTLYGLAAARAARFPDEIAVAHRSGSLTRGELMAQAGRIAGALRRHGVGPEVRVALCLPRTPGLIAAVLGVLEAGGAYVALDPAHPRERLEYVLADAGAAVLLTAEGMVPGLAPADGVRLDLAEVLAGTAGTPGPAALPGNLAYLIYTSGSTGRPKGVAVEHRSVVAFVSWARDLFSPEELKGLLASSSLGFDMSVFELFTSLSWGGTLVLVDNGLDLIDGKLPVLPAGVELTLINTVPSMAAELARARKIPPSVRTVSLCGEPLRRGLVEDLFDRSETRLLYNMYGPAETTVFSSFVLLTPESRGGPGDPTLGRPLDGERIYVANRAGGLVPIGAHGELLLGGSGLSRGYFGRPDLTAERFVPDPFGGRPGERLYRTGDLGRHRADGELEYLGRIDFQVKVRGFRVEPGEVEATLLTHPAVREAAVLAPEERGERRLIACVATDGDETEEALAGFLRERLPEHFIPSAFVMLERLPQNANGKVDRRALASVAAGISGARSETLAPRTADEELLAALWSELLPGAGPVGVRDDFFALGGHSLLATRLLGRVREAFGVELPIRTVFQAPTVEALLARIDTARRQAGELEADEIPRTPRGAGDALPLSFAQERLWFLDRLMPGSAAYNVPLALRVEGDLPTMAQSRAAFAAVVRRHEALRTVFGEEQGRPVQRIAPAPRDWPLPLVDLSVLSHGAREEEASRLAVADALKPFDLSRGPLLRTTLLRLAPCEHALLLAVHHIVSDAWSMGVLVADLTALWSGWGGWGGTEDLPELPVQYADYAAWQRERLIGEELARQTVYWRGELAGAPTALDLPTDRPRPPVPSHRGGMATVEIPEELLRAAEELARRQGATLFMVLLAAWGVLLARLAGQRDVLIGTAAANRERPELERLIGFFINTLVMRVRLADPAPSFAALLDQVRQRVLDAFSHRDLPFEKLVEELQPQRDRSRSPLFQAMLVLQNAPVGPTELPGLRITPLPVASQTAKFDLTLTFAEEDGRLCGHLEYAADLFDATTLERWNGAFLRLLAAAVADPSLAVTGIDLLAPEERRQLLVDWNRGPSDTPADVTLVDLFAAQVASTPDAVALTTRQESLTYAELADRAHRLATVLRGLGVGPEVRVGVCLPRSAALVVSLLGVLEAGGAYVPLDPAYPAERLAFMAADAGLAAVVVDEATAEHAPAADGVPRVLVEEALRPASPASLPPPPSRPPLSPRNLAYLIYTSGSTGQPKGVAVEHRSLVSLVSWSSEIYSPADLAGVLAATSVSFDVSVAELFVPFCRGGRSVLVANALDLVRGGLENAGITIASAPPSVLAELLRAGALPASVRVAALAGEPLPRALADQLYAQNHVERVYNLYGPTEDTTYSTVRLVEREGRGAPSIGRPIAGSQDYVADPEGELAPIGVRGELLLGGEGLARGYFGRPALTAERFVPDPFGDEPGGRLYRTGDLARRKADGDLDFLGRLDHQVKVRGFRVELGEIESALVRHPQVREAVVLEHSGRLTAFVSVRSGFGEDRDLAGELMRWLAQSLPEPMVPRACVLLDALPLSPNGKVDRLALARLDPAAGVVPVAEYVPPRTPLEERLAAACAEILGVERVGMQDSFFDLGGHSLLAMRLLALLHGRWEIELTLQDVFDSATVGALAELIVDRELERMDGEELAELMAEMAEMAENAELDR